jgi:hypothetical protein
MAVWEYHVVTVPSNSDLAAALNLAGASGWELVNVLLIHGDSNYCATFKRLQSR